MSIRWAAACEAAGGEDVVLGRWTWLGLGFRVAIEAPRPLVAPAGYAWALCRGARTRRTDQDAMPRLFSGETSLAAQQRLADAIQLAQQRNRTQVVRAKLRRGLELRARLLEGHGAASEPPKACHARAMAVAGGAGR